MALNKIALLLLVLCGTAYAETRVYLVDRAGAFPRDRYLLTISPQEFKRFVDTGPKDITEAKGQPFRTTSYVISADGKTALWTVTFKDEDERWHIDSMERQGYITLLSSMDVTGVYNPATGSTEIRLVENVLAEPPSDFYNVIVATNPI